MCTYYIHLLPAIFRINILNVYKDPVLQSSQVHIEYAYMNCVYTHMYLYVYLCIVNE